MGRCKWPDLTLSCKTAMWTSFKSWIIWLCKNNCLWFPGNFCAVILEISILLTGFQVWKLVSLREEMQVCIQNLMACCIQIEDYIIKFIKRLKHKLVKLVKIHQLFQIRINKENNWVKIYLPAAEVKKVHELWKS